MSNASPAPSSRSSHQGQPAAPAGNQAAHLSGVAADAGTCVDSDDLLRGRKTVDINHKGATYRLQATRLGKLILTK